MTLFGDSSAVVHYLQAIGYRMPQLEQTGSNFGTELKQDAALLTTIGSGTMVSDGLSIMNADFSASSFRDVARSRSGRTTSSATTSPTRPTPGSARTSCWARKVMVPMDGPVREDVGLLGSPCFEIPRTVARDTEFDYLKEPGELARRLRRKNRHNAMSMLLFLAVRWFQVYVGTAAAARRGRPVLPVRGARDRRRRAGRRWCSTSCSPCWSSGWCWASGRCSPRFVSIYDPYFWRHERLWKLGSPTRCSTAPRSRTCIWRLLGVRIGRRVFDDGCAIPEKTLVTIGDDVVLNAGSVIQCHSLEDGSFKSDHTVIGDGVVIGVDAFVHYGVTMGDGSVLERRRVPDEGRDRGTVRGVAGQPGHRGPRGGRSGPGAGRAGPGGHRGRAAAPRGGRASGPGPAGAGPAGDGPAGAVPAGPYAAASGPVVQSAPYQQAPYQQPPGSRVLTSRLRTVGGPAAGPGSVGPAGSGSARCGPAGSGSAGSGPAGSGPAGSEPGVSGSAGSGPAGGRPGSGGPARGPAAGRPAGAAGRVGPVHPARPAAGHPAHRRPRRPARSARPSGAATRAGSGCGFAGSGCRAGSGCPRRLRLPAAPVASPVPVAVSAPVAPAPVVASAPVVPADPQRRPSPRPAGAQVTAPRPAPVPVPESAAQPAAAPRPGTGSCDCWGGSCWCSGIDPTRAA